MYSDSTRCQLQNEPHLLGGAGGSNACEDESRVPSGPAQSGLRACPANAAMGLSAKSSLLGLVALVGLS